MAKAHSPLRLEANLVEQAALSGKQLHRSTAEQIEYWADIGRNVAKVVTPELLMQIYAGVAKVRVEPVVSPMVDPEALFFSLEEDRESGLLQKNITSSAVRYQASEKHPGLLEQISVDNSITIGQFKNGEFQPVTGVVS